MGIGICLHHAKGVLKFAHTRVTTFGIGNCEELDAQAPSMTSSSNLLLETNVWLYLCVLFL